MTRQLNRRDHGTPALITFTSGSTGQPKAAVRSHGFLARPASSAGHDLNLQAGQRDLAALPIFVLANLASAVTSIIPDADLRAPGDIAPARLLRQIRLDPADAGCRVASPSRSARTPRGVAGPRARDLRGDLYRRRTGLSALLRLLQRSRPGNGGRGVWLDGSRADRADRVERNRSRRICGRWKAAPACSSAILLPKSTCGFFPTAGAMPIGPYTSEDFDRDALRAITTGEIVVAGEHV